MKEEHLLWSLMYVAKEHPKVYEAISIIVTTLMEQDKTIHNKERTLESQTKVIEDLCKSIASREE